MLFSRIQRFTTTLRARGGRSVGLALVIACLASLGRAQPAHAPVLPIEELQPGMTGEVWTVFQGTEPEPFTVEVTGVIEGALGPGKSMILCRLTDPRVQKMGAVAGMSGSPLYVDGRFVGALSYQVQQFETERFAGFTPAADLLEVRQIALNESADSNGSGAMPATPAPGPTPRHNDSGPEITPLSPVFSFSGVSPLVAGLMSEPLEALGLRTQGLGGASVLSGSFKDEAQVELAPGYAVGAALAVGDITLAGTGTVSSVDGSRVLAFGHPLLGLGTVEVPMTEAEIVAILPSSRSSFKISNTGKVIGTVRQDRLSAIYGEIGRVPPLLPITVHTPQRDLNFAAVKHPRITPVVTATGISQAVLGSNDAGLSEGFALRADVIFPGGRKLQVDQLFAGPEGFKAGLTGLTQSLGTWMDNPVEAVFPEALRFTVEALEHNPTVSLDNATLTRQQVRPGETVDVVLQLRDYQGAPFTERVTVPIAADWADEKLAVVIANGPALDQGAGAQQVFAVSQIRDFDAYLDALRARRKSDGVYVAVVRAAKLFLDQTAVSTELPDSLSRIARQADGARYQEKAAVEVLWEQHLLPDRLVPTAVRLPLSWVD
ncbi:SpoIVB peptidase S55 domain-containing protein [Actomonas aquatica]|uniref:SpoIVB peptidase S55 domain-containing protein n=1 Tax=Actomonas aquatica TaxID=2866162 RepID=A0ABZ1CCL0_9BACT|nr:SpoIVB peptidase S55 domain-containing protein [Opitutus sp. WL0086]WRQ88344.1 SpoIVB peptidase S55 domain-containing protein [Opitutus sp. WL0086]